MESPVYKGLNSQNIIEKVEQWRLKNLELLDYNFALVDRPETEHAVGDYCTSQRGEINFTNSSDILDKIDFRYGYVTNLGKMFGLSADKPFVKFNTNIVENYSNFPYMRTWQQVGVFGGVNIKSAQDGQLLLEFRQTGKSMVIHDFIKWLISTELLYMYCSNDKYYRTVKFDVWDGASVDLGLELKCFDIQPPKYESHGWFKYVEITDDFAPIGAIRKHFQTVFEKYKLKDKEQKLLVMMKLLGL